MVTRQDELQRVLGELCEDLPNPLWAALVDDDGLIMACVPGEPPVNPDRISAMTAAAVLTGDRVLNEMEAGQLRYATFSGAHRQVITVVLGEERYLSLGMNPDVRAQATFAPLSRWVPELMKTLKMRISSEDNEEEPPA